MPHYCVAALGLGCVECGIGKFNQLAFVLYIGIKERKTDTDRELFIWSKTIYRLRRWGNEPRLFYSGADALRHGITFFFSGLWQDDHKLVSAIASNGVHFSHVFRQYPRHL